ncbi:hypothetical protein [Leifsonia sp. AG29]|uniref:hypothetical protein n=1 Tax=Leifsonia sp. AG29 TaxID=2598860 RepID=UPI001E5D3BD0|nr:hypothetical protein [Leifsonia sp. AG29]
MTLWPDQPTDAGAQPRTRRQARESERSQAARRAGTAEPTRAGDIPQMTGTGHTVSPAASTEGAAPAGAATPDQKGRPAEGRPAIPATAFAEPGVSAPSRSDFDSLFSGEPAASPAGTPATGSSLFRQAPDTSRPEPVTQPMAIVTPPAKAGGADPATPSDARPSDGAAGPVPERTLTRRELRAMLQAQQANDQANHPMPAGDAVFPVTFTAQPGEGASAPVKSATAPAPAPASEETVAEPNSSEKTAWPFAPLTPSAAPQRAATDTTVTSSPASPFASFGSSAPTSARPAANPIGVPATEAAAAQTEAPAEDTSSQERRPFTPPTGHWSTAAELEDQNEPITTRNVGHSTAATTTNALILPSLPQPDATAPLTSTGEILVTGSIDLPRTLGSTGAHPDRIDSSDLDRLLDGEENEFNTSEVAPVRASRAISTHTSTRGVITPPKKRGNLLPVVLMITAGVLAVGVIGLLVAAYVLKVF